LFPSTYQEIRALAGIGDYTAAAVASISFHLPYAVVDGNVLRVIARLTNDDSNIANPATRKRFAATAQQMLDIRQPGEYNQAIMELGATVCTPRNPQCGECPVSRWCEARAAGVAAALPVKIRAKKQEQIDLQLLVIRNASGSCLVKPSTRVSGFWDLPEWTDLTEANTGEEIATFKHQITFRQYICHVFPASIVALPAGFRWLEEGMPLSTIATKALQKCRAPLHKKRNPA
jgi:A/G-specific adenine glycosylase